MRMMIIDVPMLKQNKIHVELRADGNIQIEDNNDPLDLFNQEAVEMLSSMFGERKTDDMLSDADLHISREVFAMKLQSAMRYDRR